jgi:hypothetical protein
MTLRSVARSVAVWATAVAIVIVAFWAALIVAGFLRDG